MADLTTKEGDITTAGLASYGTPPKQLVPEKRKKMIKPSTQDRTEGKLHEVKGRIKEEAGKLTNDSNLEISGTAEKDAGKVQNWVGRAEKAIGE